MIDFSNLTASEKELIVRLPYRVGVWISESDDLGGEDADLIEQQALIVIITAYVEDFCKTEFVQRVMEQTVAHKAEWSSWHENIDTVPDECRKVMHFLSGKIPDKEIMAFRANLTEIGYSVAMAYREFDDEASFTIRIQTYLRLWLERVSALIKGDVVQSQDEFLNISASERIALERLSEVLALVKVPEPEIKQPVKTEEVVADEETKEE
ncbi:MAG: hypothetical protein JKY11_06360 [Alphaproteobacteria bacterium]|nr:hypothetical protein [Alphaproteobacteria bacterium]